jgi:hypothetical protein
LESFQPEVLFYNAGTDCLKGDPLGGMQLTAAGIRERDEIVFHEALMRKIPVVMVLSGGYARGTAKVIGDSIHNLVTKFNLLQRCEIKSNFIPRGPPTFHEESSTEEQRSSMEYDQVIQVEEELHNNNDNARYNDLHQYDSREFEPKDKRDSSEGFVSIRTSHLNNNNTDSIGEKDEDSV